MSDEQTIDIVDAIASIKESEPIVVTSIEELQPKAKVKGIVKRTELYGAFIDLGVGTDALIHISQLGRKRVNRVSDVMTIGDEVVVWIDRVDVEKKQISATMIEPQPVDWRDLKAGQAYAGTITRLERFGVFVAIGAEKEGLVHVSELSHEFVRNPSQVARVGDRVNVKVLGFNKKKRRIDLSIKALLEAPEAEDVVDYSDIEDEDDGVELPSAMEIAWRRATGKDRGSNDHSSSARRGRKRRHKLRRQQDDIISRTLSTKMDME